MIPSRMLLGLVSALLAAVLAAAPPLHPVAIDSPPAAGSRVPDLTALPDGRLVMSWIEPVSGGSVAFRCAIHDGRRWSAPATIAAGESLLVNWADFPSIRALGGSRLAAHWLVKIAGAPHAYGVRIAQSNDLGRSWSAPVTPHRDGTATEHGFVSLVPAPGGVVATWLDGRNTEGHEEGTANMTLRAAVVTADGRITDERELDGRVCDCCQTGAAATDRGIVVAYRDRDPKEVRDIAVVRLVEGSWTEPAVVGADGWRIAGCPVNGPSLAAHGSRVALAWFSAARDTPRVLAAFSSDGGTTFGHPIRVDGGDPSGRVHVAWIGDGAAFVTWLESEGSDALFRARRVAADGTVDSSMTIARLSGARATGFPRVVSCRDRLYFAWTEPGEPTHVRLAMARVPPR